MKHRYSFLFLPLHLLIDLFCLNGSFWLSYQVKFEAQGSYSESNYWVLQLICNVVWLLLVLVLKPHKYSRLRFHVFDLLQQYAIFTFMHAAAVAFCWILLKDWGLSRLQLFYFYLMFFVLGSIWRTLGVITLKIYRASGHNTRRYAIVGYGKLSIAIKRFYENHPEMGYQFYGFFDDLTPDNRFHLRGDYERLDALIASGTIDCVYCCAPYMQREVLNRLVSKSPIKDYQVKLVIDFESFVGRKSSIEYLDMLPIMTISNQMWEDVKVKWLKRVFDVCFALSVLVLGSPVFIIVALITKLTSKGPIIFSQERTGRLGNRFMIHKFRSMIVGASQGHAGNDLDDRITAWGKFMRKTRLDEIPQFYNVLKGDMSIVGPRPLADYDVKTLTEIASEEFKQILAVKPGITSIGQVKFGYARTADEMKTRLRYDLIYLKKISFFFDMWLIMYTVADMVKGKGK
ncbi:MAG: sugar transferase [Cytophagia bacterium]|nr:MAG: sugar transferase [Cytophagales bacterium]TAG38184.1 MAG: sugar transferase [Cytophagia bacterium]TAG51347.1 MAG: sugar transferase [Runella slithyformis]